MIDYVKSFMLELEFECDAVESLSSDICKIYSNEEAKNIFEAALSAYDNDMNTDFDILIKMASECADLANIHEYSAYMLLMLSLSKRLRVYYRENNINDDIWFDSMLDLRWKHIQCKLLKGVWGTFVPEWYGGFFNLTRFALGRLQFDTLPFRYSSKVSDPYVKDGVSIAVGSTVIGVHIPRSPIPFNAENCDASFERAKNFFKDKFNGAPMAFVCNSWILYKEHETFLHEKSNVRKFMSRFDIIRSYIDPAGDVTGVFDMEPTGNIDDYPEDTFLRKAYKDFLKAGGKPGKGYGIFIAK